MSLFLLAAAAVAYTKREEIAGYVGEKMAPKAPKKADAELDAKQSIREYNALTDRMSSMPPAECVCTSCLAAGKANRRKDRHNLILKAKNAAWNERDPAKKEEIKRVAERLGKDMDRVEDAKLSQYTYTANSDENSQPEYLRQIRNQPPPGFRTADISKMADDFGVNEAKLKKLELIARSYGEYWGGVGR